MPTGDGDIQFHRNVGRGGCFQVLKQEELHRAEQWLQALMDANRCTGRYPEEVFRKIVAGVWFKVCYHAGALGTAMLSRYTMSALRRTAIRQRRNGLRLVLSLSGAGRSEIGVKEMKAMILAAGKGTRLQSLTETVPKPMLPVAGRPVLAHIIEWLWRYGIHQVAINLHYHPEVVREYFDDDSWREIEITYSEEPVLLGTAGGVKKMEAFFGDPFLVVYGDVLTDLDLGALLAFHQLSWHSHTLH